MKPRPVASPCQRAIATLAIGLVLLLGVLAACPGLHEHLHAREAASCTKAKHAHATQAGEDGCVIAGFAHGHAGLVPAPTLLLACAPRRESGRVVHEGAQVAACRFRLPPSLGPPLG